MLKRNAIQKILTKCKIDDIYSNVETDLLVLSLTDRSVEIYKNEGKITTLEMPLIDYISITPYNVLLTGGTDFVNYSLDKELIARRSDTYISSYDPKTNTAILFFAKEGRKSVIKYDFLNDKNCWEVDVNNVRIMSCVINNVLCVVHFDMRGIMLIDYSTGTILNNFHKEEFKFRRIIGTSEDEFIFSSSDGILLFNPENQAFSNICIAQLIAAQGLDFGEINSFSFEYNSDTGYVYSLKDGYFVEMDIGKKGLVRAVDINNRNCNTYGVKLRILNHTRKDSLLYFIARDAMRILKGGYIGVFDMEKEKIVDLLDTGLGVDRFLPGKSSPAIVGNLMYVHDSENDLLEFQIDA
jgi:hypothetical protein